MKEKMHVQKIFRNDNHQLIVQDIRKKNFKCVKISHKMFFFFLLEVEKSRFKNKE